LTPGGLPGQSGRERKADLAATRRLEEDLGWSVAHSGAACRVQGCRSMSALVIPLGCTDGCTDIAGVGTRFDQPIDGHGVLAGKPYASAMTVPYEDVDIGPIRQVGRVREVADGGRLLYMELRNGQFATVTSDRPMTIEGGAVVLIGEDSVTVAPPSLWPEETAVGVVRLRGEQFTVVDASGHIRVLPTRHRDEYALGNTIEFDRFGFIRKLSDDPIRSIDLPSIDDVFVTQFIIEGGSDPLDFSDFGGNPGVLSRALELVETPLKHHDKLLAIGARPIKGVLFTGPPGTGKTILARIISAKAGATFYRINGPEIVSKWYGQSEEILRQIFAHARRQERAIIFFDEIDSVASQRNEESHEASRRMVAQLLTLMDGFEPANNVVVIATTNRPQDIDIAPSTARKIRLGGRIWPPDR
jgi:transitional endoplasmic reticulum ATPase